MTMPSKIWASESRDTILQFGVWTEISKTDTHQYIRADIANELALALAKMDHLGADQIIALDRYHAAIGASRDQAT